MRVYHATAVSNVESIREKGLLKVWEGVYLTDSEESAQRWIGFRLKAMGHDKMAIIEAEVNPSILIEGTDHSPIMELIFGVGKSLLSPKAIPASKIKNIKIVSI
jgi:hypothetical protein